MENAFLKCGGSNIKSLSTQQFRKRFSANRNNHMPKTCTCKLIKIVSHLIVLQQISLLCFFIHLSSVHWKVKYNISFLVYSSHLLWLLELLFKESWYSILFIVGTSSFLKALPMRNSKTGIDIRLSATYKMIFNLHGI